MLIIKDPSCLSYFVICNINGRILNNSHFYASRPILLWNGKGKNVRGVRVGFVKFVMYMFGGKNHIKHSSKGQHVHHFIRLPLH